MPSFVLLSLRIHIKNVLSLKVDNKVTFTAPEIQSCLARWVSASAEKNFFFLEVPKTYANVCLNSVKILFKREHKVLTILDLEIKDANDPV